MTYYQNPYQYNFGYYPNAQPVILPQQQAVYPQQSMTEPNYNVQSGQTSLKPNDSYFIWVQGEAGAKSYPVARGTTVPLFDSEGDYVYFKSVDSNGVPLPLVTKVISDPPVEIKAEVVEEKSISPDMDNFVTKKNYDELVKKYVDLENRLLELETKPATSYNSTFTGNTFNNSRKGKDDGNKFTV